MKKSCLIAVCLPAFGLAQGIFFSGSSSAGSFASSGGTSSISGSETFIGRQTNIGNLSATLRHAPPIPALPANLHASYRGRSASGISFFDRVVTDTSNHSYFGYEVTLEEQQPGTYLATFGKPGLTPMEAAVSNGSNAKDWHMLEITLPQPRTVHDGDLISIELASDPATGDKLFDDILIQLQPYAVRPSMGIVRAPILSPLRTQPDGRTVPTVEGSARDFSAADAEMQIRQPRITLNGMPQSTGIGSPAGAQGTLIWFYLPGRGRYVLSLAPHPELDFRKSGEVRGGSIKFTIGDDTITLECFNDIAPGHAPYNLYVLLDPLWEPTARAQKGQFAIGSVDAGELAKLKIQ